MGYLISYDLTGTSKKSHLLFMRLSRQIKIAIGVSLIGLGVLCVSFVPTIRNLFIPGNPEVTEAAFLEMLDDLRSGEALNDAVTTFCQEIISDAGY